MVLTARIQPAQAFQVDADQLLSLLRAEVQRRNGLRAYHRVGLQTMLPLERTHRLLQVLIIGQRLDVQQVRISQRPVQWAGAGIGVEIAGENQPLRQLWQPRVGRPRLDQRAVGEGGEIGQVCVHLLVSRAQLTIQVEARAGALERRSHVLQPENAQLRHTHAHRGQGRVRLPDRLVFLLIQPTATEVLQCQQIKGAVMQFSADRLDVLGSGDDVLPGVEPIGGQIEQLLLKGVNPFLILPYGNVTGGAIEPVQRLDHRRSAQFRQWTGIGFLLKNLLNRRERYIHGVFCLGSICRKTQTTDE